MAMPACSSAILHIVSRFERELREMTLAFQPNHSCVSTEFTVISLKQILKDHRSHPRKPVDGRNGLLLVYPCHDSWVSYSLWSLFSVYPQSEYYKLHTERIFFSCSQWWWSIHIIDLYRTVICRCLGCSERSILALTFHVEKRDAPPT